MSKYSRPKTGFAALDREWKSHRSHCARCASAKQLPDCCDRGIKMYQARLNATDAAATLKTVKPGVE